MLQWYVWCLTISSYLCLWCWDTGLYMLQWYVWCLTMSSYLCLWCLDTGLYTLQWYVWCLTISSYLCLWCWDTGLYTLQWYVWCLTISSYLCLWCWDTGLYMSHHGHWDQHPRTYSASREPTWKPTVTDHLVPVPQNYGISSQIIFGQLGVWQSSNDNWKHICSKMYLSNNYVDINIYPLTMNVMRLWACLYGKGAISNDNIIIILLLYAAVIRMMSYYVFLSLSLVLGHRALYAAVIRMMSYTISLQLYVSCN